MYARYIVSYSRKGIEWIFKLRFFQDMKMERKKEPEWLFKDFQCKIKAVLKAVHHFPSHPLWVKIAPTLCCKQSLHFILH